MKAMPFFAKGDVRAEALASSSNTAIRKLQRSQPSENEMEISELIQQACKEGYLDTIKYLLSRCDIHLSHYSFLALSSAVQRNQCQVVKLLLTDNRIDPTQNKCQVVYQTAHFGYTQMVDLFLSNDRVVECGGRQAAFDGAVEFGSFSLVDELLESKDVNPAKDDNHAIRQTASRNDIRMMKQLLGDSRVDPSANNNDALIKAACMGHKKAVELLIRDARIYVNGTIPQVSQDQAQSFHNSAETATKLVRNSVLTMLAGGDIPFDVYETFSCEALSAVDVSKALQTSHDSSIATGNQIEVALRVLCEDVVVEILWMLVGNSIFPWQPASERRTNLRMLLVSCERIPTKY